MCQNCKEPFRIHCNIDGSQLQRLMQIRSMKCLDMTGVLQKFDVHPFHLGFI